MYLVPPSPPIFKVEDLKLDECCRAGINKRPSMLDALSLPCSNFEFGGHGGWPSALVSWHVGVYLSRTGVEMFQDNWFKSARRFVAIPLVSHAWASTFPTQRCKNNSQAAYG